MTETHTKRLLSIDALRGFDMFFIMGGGMLVVAGASVFSCDFSDVLIAQMGHVEWHGFAFFDIIFPLFLFIAGISFPFSLDSQRQRNLSQKSIYLKIIRRGLILVLLGCIYNGLLSLDFANVRYFSVLGRIGLAWMFAALIFMHTSTKVRIVITSLILLGYWALLSLVSAPDSTAGGYTFEGNIVGYVDRMMMFGRLNAGSFDPEGLLSTIPAVATALLGMFAGEIVKHPKTAGKRKAVSMALLGVGLIFVGVAWNVWMPINKSLWTSSFVLLVGGLSFLLFALFYYLIDVRGWHRWAFFFKVIGLNSITIYMAQTMINFGYTDRFLFQGLAHLFPESIAPFIMATGYVALCWGMLYALYKYKIFLKV